MVGLLRGVSGGQMQTIGLPEIKIKKPWVPRSFKKVEIDRGVLRLACRHAVVYGIYKAAEKYGINRETFRNNFKKRYPLIYKNKGNLNFVYRLVRSSEPGYFETAQEAIEEYKKRHVAKFGKFSPHYSETPQ
jgi:hypothetical protein